MDRFKTALAQLISYPLHPGLMPTLGALMILYSVPEVYDWNRVTRIVLLVFLGTYIGPILVVGILRLSGVIQSVHLIRKEDRIYPYMAGVVCILGTGHFLRYLLVPTELLQCVYVSALAIMLNAILLPFWKSSAHMTGIAASLALFLILHNRYGVGNSVTLITFVALVGGVAWARIWLKRHTPLELLSGGLIGFLSLYLVLSKS